MGNDHERVSKSDHPSLDIVYDEVKQRLNQQFEQIESLNQRGTVLLGLVATITSVISGITALSIGDFSARPCLPAVLLIAAAALYIAVLLVTYRAYKIRTYRRDPEPKPLRDKYKNEDSNTTKETLINNFIQSYDDNSRTINEKIQALKTAYKLVIIQVIYVVMLALAFVMYKMRLF